MLKKKVNTNNRILPGIQSFAWNFDRSLVAVCPQSKEILIFATNGKPDIKDWRLVEVLREVSIISQHTRTQSNRISRAI